MNGLSKHTKKIKETVLKNLDIAERIKGDSPSQEDIQKATEIKDNIKYYIDLLRISPDEKNDIKGFRVTSQNDYSTTYSGLAENEYITIESSVFGTSVFYKGANVIDLFTYDGKESNQEDTLPKIDWTLLPDVLSAYGQNMAQLNRYDDNMMAISLLAAASSAIGNNLHVQPTNNPTHIEYPNLWALIIAPSSSKKSGIANESFKPIKVYDKKLYDEYEEAMAKYLELQNKRSELSKGNKEIARKKIEEFEKEHPNMKPPRETNILVNILSPERLPSLIRESRGRLTALYDEGFLFFRMIRENRAGDMRSNMLSAWGGNGTVKVNRQARDKQAYVTNASISVVLFMQPDHFEKELKIYNKEKDGLFPRFQLVAVKGKPKKRISVAFDPTARDNYFNKIHDLLTLTKRDTPLRFDTRDGASDLIEKYIFENEDKLEIEDDPLLREIIGKRTTFVCGLSAILHSCNIDKYNDITDYTISKDTLERAIKIAEFCEAHLRHLLQIDDRKFKRDEVLAKKVMEQVNKFKMRGATEVTCSRIAVNITGRNNLGKVTAKEVETILSKHFIGAKGRYQI